MAKRKEVKDNWFKRAVQARWLSAGFYRRHFVGVALVVGLIVLFTLFKFDVQMKMRDIMASRKNLLNAQTDMVRVSAEYSSRIRESEMTELVDTLHLRLKAPEQPPYNLDYKHE